MVTYLITPDTGVKLAWATLYIKPAECEVSFMQRTLALDLNSEHLAVACSHVINIENHRRSEARYGSVCSLSYDTSPCSILTP